MNKTFPEILQQTILAIEEMLEAENQHFDYLVRNDAPEDFIKIAKEYRDHYKTRLQEYREYYEKLV